MNLDELCPILHGYRKQLEAAWSPATAHEDYEGKQGDPTGQCGVTSAWLQRRLREDHGIATAYCVGAVFSVCGEESADHCWLESGDGPGRLVIDLTASQMDYLKNLPIVCMPASTLKHHWIDYQVERALSPVALATDPVQARLSILTEALS